MIDRPDIITRALPLTTEGLVESGHFPGFGDRLGRARRRIAGKAGAFWSAGLAGTLFPAAIVVASFWGAVGQDLGAGKISLTTSNLAVLAAAGVAALALALVFQAAMGAAAAFKITSFRVFSVGISRSWAHLLTTACGGLALVLPFILVLPGLALLPRLLLTLPLILTEKRWGFTALARSHDLVAGRSARLLLEFALVNLPAAAASAAAGVAAATLAPQIAAAWGWPTVAVGVAAGVAVFLLAQTVNLPLNAAFIQVFYEDCVREKGWDWEPRMAWLRLYQALAALGLVAAVVLPALGARYFLASLASPVAPPAVVAEVPAVVETTKPAPLAPDERDLERYGHASLLRVALSDYRAETGTYPTTLQTLVPRHLASMPTDPSSGEPYRYESTGPDYTVTFTLEAGAFALAAGEHTLTSRGFDVPTSAVTTTPATTAGQGPSAPILPLPIDAADIQPPTPLFETPIPSAPEDATATAPTSAEEAVAPEAMATVAAASADADRDGLTDGEETAAGSDANAADSDGDGLTDGEEAIVYRTDPTVADTDGDGYADGTEVAGGYEPLGAGKLTKTRLDEIMAGRTRLEERLAAN